MAANEISINEAQPGMVTARDIMDNEGRILIHSGSRLTPIAIRRLPLWNIKSIFIEIDENSEQMFELKFERTPQSEEDSNINTALISEMALKVKNRFQSVEQDEFYKTYMTVLLKYLVNNNNNGNGIIPGSY